MLLFSTAIQQSDLIIYINTFSLVFFSVMVYHRRLNLVPHRFGSLILLDALTGPCICPSVALLMSKRLKSCPHSRTIGGPLAKVTPYPYTPPPGTAHWPTDRHRATAGKGPPSAESSLCKNSDSRASARVGPRIRSCTSLLSSFPCPILFPHTLPPSTSHVPQPCLRLCFWGAWSQKKL